MGMLDLGHEYMAGVKARARMLRKAASYPKQPQVTKKTA